MRLLSNSDMILVALHNLGGCATAKETLSELEKLRVAQGMKPRGQISCELYAIHGAFYGWRKEHKQKARSLGSHSNYIQQSSLKELVLTSSGKDRAAEKALEFYTKLYNISEA